MLSAYHARANSLKTHGFLSSTYLTLHPAARRDVMLFHVDSGLFLALLMTLNQTDLSPYKSYLSGSGAQSYWTSFHGISILPPQECHECYFSGSGPQSRWTTIVVKSCWESCVHHFTLHLIPLFELLAVLFAWEMACACAPHPPYSMLGLFMGFFMLNKSPYSSWKIQHW